MVEGRETAPELLGGLYTPVTDADLGELLDNLPRPSAANPSTPTPRSSHNAELPVSEPSDDQRLL